MFNFDWTHLCVCTFAINNSIICGSTELYNLQFSISAFLPRTNYLQDFVHTTNTALMQSFAAKPRNHIIYIPYNIPLLNGLVRLRQRYISKLMLFNIYTTIYV